jgi:tRNA(Arg) A34 adenosine deaminase TadA
MVMNLEQFMKRAIEEAKTSLCEGNNGFGAVIVRDDKIIASSHDKEGTEHDPTSHAEINAIKDASKVLGRKLSGCILVSTHEPCPMCSYAIVWSGIAAVAYGYSIREAISQKRKRIDLPCKDAFENAGVNIAVYPSIMKAECSVLYKEDVRKEIENLRNADDKKLKLLCDDSIIRRTKWFEDNKGGFDFIDHDDLLLAGYRLLLERFHITPEEAPILRKTDKQIVFHSRNFCPTLEACKILDLDTRFICKKLNEASTDLLVKQIDRRLAFSRNYDKLRPYAEYCEEMISLSLD